MHTLDSRLFVFSTQRAITSFYASQQEGLMPKAMGIDELFSRAFFTPSKSAASTHIYRILLHTILRTLLDQRPALTKLLVFEQSFLGYLQGSEFLLPFFREIARHKVAMSEIPLRDIYADYEEHLAILEEIYTRFVARLDELGLERLDDKQEVIKEFVQGFSQIEIYLDGLLNPIEQDKLYALSAYTPLYIHIDTDSYNYAYFRWLYAEIEPGFSYTIILDSREVDSKGVAKGADCRKVDSSGVAMGSTPSTTLARKHALPDPKQIHIHALYFELRIAQCSFVLEKVRKLLASGVSGDEIIIITPDESFSEYFALLDSAHNLNYAMGRELLSSPKIRAWCDELRSVLEAITQRPNAMSDLAFVESIFTYIFTQANAKANTQTSLDSTNAPIYQAHSSLDSSHIALLDTLPPCPLTTRLQAKILGIIGDYLRVESVLEEFGYEQLLELLFLRIQELGVDDVFGGKVRVMGVLETRGIACDYVIMVDCNSGFLPRIKESDVFLNTAIREKLQMPTLQDRENLQKHYYYQLFMRARKGVFVTFTHNEEARESSLLNELELQGVSITRDNGDNLYALFAVNEPKPYVEEEIVAKVGDFVFSPTSLAVFAECKRKFYCRYIARLKEPEPLESTFDSLALGELVHKALEHSYGARVGVVCDKACMQMIEQECQEYLRTQLQHTQTQGFSYELIRQDLRGFWQLERRLAGSGFFVLACEQGFVSSVAIDSKQYKITGKIDRIDKLADGKWRVIDYKLSKPSKASRDKHLLQLAFYRLALESSALVFSDTASALAGTKPARIESMVYYLKDAKPQKDRALLLSQEDFHAQKERIIELFKQTSGEVCFEKTQDTTSCVHCAYADMCNR